MTGLRKSVSVAIKHFWATRTSQKQKQRKKGATDQGRRGAVTGGGQLDGFVELTRALLIKNGIPDDALFCKSRVDLPGFFRPTKEWDLLVVKDGKLLASVEFKAQVGPSFGNNFNNRTEEAIGSAVDLWTAYREGAFQRAPKPWLGYFFVLEEAPGSTRPVGAKESHFPVFGEFKEASYAKRYEILCGKLVTEKIYDASCLLLTNESDGPEGRYKEPSKDLGVNAFFNSLLGSVIAATKGFTK